MPIPRVARRSAKLRRQFGHVEASMMERGHDKATAAKAANAVVSRQAKRNARNRRRGRT